jgi:hypothetical protein
MYSGRWNENWQAKLKYSEKTCPNVILSTTNPTSPDLQSNPDRRGGKMATNRLSTGFSEYVIIKSLNDKNEECKKVKQTEMKGANKLHVHNSDVNLIDGKNRK